jgi:hypothetical protein
MPFLAAGQKSSKFVGLWGGEGGRGEREGRGGGED